MADDSPGKVQALRAIFSEKNQPLMGIMPPGGKIPSRPWRAIVTSTEDIVAHKDKKLNELRLGNKVLPVPEKNSSSLHDTYNKTIPKPAVGPKPSYLVQQLRTAVCSTVPENPYGTTMHRTNDENLKQRNNCDGITSDPKAKAFGETIASFMFTNNHKENVDQNSEPTPPIPKPRTIHIQNHVEIMNLCNSQMNGFKGVLENSQSCNINFDNYICKTSCRIRRKELPLPEKLGPAPSKPTKPPHLKLPPPHISSSSLVSVVNSQRFSQGPPSSLPQKTVIQKPSYPCPPRPTTPPPLPPSKSSSLREVVEELYEDTIQEGRRERPVSLISEYTEEEELYNDAVEESDSSLINKSPEPSEYLQPNNNHTSTEELYQDADGPETEEFYEVMPCDETPDEAGSPLYSNNKKEIERLKKEEEKRTRKEQKEKEKREKEMEKLKKKFGLTGGEVPIDDGLVKSDNRGGKGDLPVKRGETVLILRMEGNPSGRWLVKNEKGKIGYVELTNIEVDPLSVKSAPSTAEESSLCSTPLEKNVNWLTKITACVR